MRYPLRLVLRLTLALLLIAAVTLAGGLVWFYAGARAALPQLDGSLAVRGLTAPVEVVRDAHGVPHLRASSAADLFFAQGYVTAQDRLWQMDVLRRAGAGRLAEVLGPSLVASDRRQRILLTRQIAQRSLAALSPRDHGHFEAYARGVSAFIETHRDRLPIEFRVLRYQPQPWTAEDSFFAGVGLVESLSLGQYAVALSRERVTAALGPELAADLYPNTSPRDRWPGWPGDKAKGKSQKEKSPGVAVNQPPAVGAQDFRPVNHPHEDSWASAPGTFSFLLLPFALEPSDSAESPGSNNWVVSGARTASGRPLLSNDMHLGHTIPDVWYEAHLQGPGVNVAGFTFPGLPYVVAGHNQRIAWGFTNLGPAVEDLFVETFNDRGQYQTPAGWQAPERRRETIHVKGQPDVTVDVVITRHGPIISDLAPGETRRLALQWTFHQLPVELPFFDLNIAGNWPEFRAALARFNGSAQNVVYADVDGHIGYQAAGRIPIRRCAHARVAQPPSAVQARVGPDLRSGRAARRAANDQSPCDASLPVPGSTGSPARAAFARAGVQDDSHEWTGYVPFDQLPSVLDPPSGIIATANARITPDAYPHLLANQWGPPYRTERIYRVLESGCKLTAADMLALQTDVYSDFDHFCAQQFAQGVERASNASPRARQAAQLMRAWDGRLTADSAAATLITVSRRELTRLLLEPRLGPSAEPDPNAPAAAASGWRIYRWFRSSVALEKMLVARPARWLPPGVKDWDQLLAAAVEAAALEDPCHPQSRVGTAALGRAGGPQGRSATPLDLNCWRWGSFSPLELRHPIFGAVPVLRRWASIGVGPGVLPQSGGSFTVKQVGRRFGPSERATYDLADLDASTLNIVTGQSGQLFSPHATDHFAAWYQGQSFAFPFSDVAIRRARAHQLTLVPAH